jgi:putative addiction module component (TIGR02574 family)
MTKAEIQERALELPAAERQELVEALWSSLEQEAASVPVWQRTLIDERLEQLESDPDPGMPWSEAEESARENIEDFELTEEQKAQLKAAMAEADRGEGVDGWGLLVELRG